MTRRFVIDKNIRFLFAFLNVNEAQILRKSGIPIDFFQRRTPSLNTEEFFRLTHNLFTEARTDVPIPLKLTEMPLGFFSPQIMAAVCSPHFSCFAHRIAKYKPLMGPFHLALDEDDQFFSLRLSSIDPNYQLHPILVLSDMTFWVKIIREATQQHIKPISIEIQTSVEGEGYSDYFGVPLTPGKQDCITFSKADAFTPFQTHNDAVWEYFEPEMRKKLNELEHNASFARRVRAVLLELLPLGQSTITAVAAKLCISTRTLQRRLKSENTSFQRQLNLCRERLAKHYLLHSEMSIAEIAFLLGFEEHSSFTRAFNQWTQSSPEIYRSKHNYLELISSS